MVEFAKNKWKYSTIGLLAVLAVGFSFPQASAHVTSNVQHILSHMIESLTGIDAKVTDIQEEIDDLGSKAIVIEIENQEVTGGGFFTLLPAQEGKVYGGHISVAQFGSGGITLTFQCLNSDATTVIAQTDQGVRFGNSVNTDFSCEQLQVFTEDSGGFDLFGSIHYEETDATVITDFSN